MRYEIIESAQSFSHEELDLYQKGYHETIDICIRELERAKEMYSVSTENLIGQFARDLAYRYNNVRRGTLYFSKPRKSWFYKLEHNTIRYGKQSKDREFLLKWANELLDSLGL